MVAGPATTRVRPRWRLWRGSSSPSVAEVVAATGVVEAGGDPATVATAGAVVVVGSAHSSLGWWRHIAHLPSESVSSAAPREDQSTVEVAVQCYGVEGAGVSNG